MKTAEEWEDVIGNIPEPEAGDPHGWEPYWEKLRQAIHAIQADALEAAAKECEEYGAARMARDERAMAATCVQCAVNIRTLKDAR